MKGLYRFFVEHNEKLIDIAEEMIYRTNMSVSHKNFSDSQLKAKITKECRAICEKYLSEDLFPEMAKEILKDIEADMDKGQMTSNARRDYIEIGNAISKKFHDVADDFRMQERILSVNDYSDYWADWNRKKDGTTSKFSGSLGNCIEQYKQVCDIDYRNIVQKVRNVDTRFTDELLKKGLEEKEFKRKIEIHNEKDKNVQKDILNEESQEDNKDGAELVRIGVAYMYGRDGSKKDIDKAKEYFEKAVNLDYVEGYTYLGFYYDFIKENYGRAVQYYEEAIERGSTKALLYLGDAYWLGKGVVSNRSMAESYYIKAGAEGEGLAFVRMGELRERNASYNAGKEYYETCLEYYKKAAEMGEIEGLNKIVEAKLGNFKYNISSEKYAGIDVNIEEVIENYEKMLEEIPQHEMILYKNKSGYYNLGMLYKMKNNNERAWQIFHELINADSYYAEDEYILEFYGDMYRTGIVVEKDKGKAKEYYRKGLEKAKERLKSAISNKYDFLIKYYRRTIMRLKKKIIMG